MDILCINSLLNLVDESVLFVLLFDFNLAVNNSSFAFSLNLTLKNKGLHSEMKVFPFYASTRTLLWIWILFKMNWQLTNDKL